MEDLLRRRESLLVYIFEHKNIGRLLGSLFTINIVLYIFYGLVMGLHNGWIQMLSSGLKIPILFILSLVVCFPVLYVVNVLMGSQLNFAQTLALILSAMALNAILLASCAPIVLFFMLIGSQYDFLKLLHVLIFGFGGIWVMLALHRGLEAMCEKSAVYPRQAVRILLFWSLVFGFVGTQMAWSLRPFLGAPNLAFELFRQHEQMNFYQAVWHSILNL